jgi:hypothetical protein
MNETLLSKLNRVQLAGLIMGVAGLVGCAVGAFLDTARFFPAYLFGYLFWLGLALGCFGVAMIHYLTGGRWGNPTRRFLEAGYMTLPLMAALFVPIFFGLSRLYPWARPAAVAASKVLQHKASYMNSTAFVVRMIFYFLVWIVMTWLLRKWSLEQDRTSEVEPTRRMRVLSGPGIVIYPLTTTFAYVDWIMSLETDWYSTMFGVIICAGQVLVAFVFITILLAWFKNYEPVSQATTPAPFHQLGNLILSFVVFWTYVSFGQFLIIWSGNLPREIVWYLHRTGGNWTWIIGFLAAFHFFFPFFLLLFRTMKRQIRALVILAAVVFVAHIVEMFWLITPSFYPAGIAVNWIDFAALLGVGGVWTAMFIAMLKRAPLLARNDPRIHHPNPQLATAHGQ